MTVTNPVSVTIDRAAALLHVCRRTVYNRIAEGRLVAVRRVGGTGPGGTYQRVLVSSIVAERRRRGSAAIGGRA